MRPPLDDATVAHDQDAVGVSDGAQTMGDHKTRATSHQLVNVYRYLMTKGVYKKGSDALYFALSTSGITYGKIMIALRAFSQLSLIEENDGISIAKTNGKVDLMSAEILKELKGRVENEC